VPEDNLTANIDRSYGFVAINRGVVIQQFLAGMSTLPTHYSGYIQNFLTEYLGTDERPTPFGGRTHALNDLQEWLCDSHSPPYMLLASAAGRGKSALLVQWSANLLSNTNLDVVFVPISVRFGLSSAHVFFTAALARIAKIYGEEISNISSLPAEALQSMLHDYLNRKRPDGRCLLLIIDGIDEAADWNLGAYSFPVTPPDGIRILVSARETAGQSADDGWMQVLGWNKPGLAKQIGLGPLSADGICEVLKHAGFPTNGTQENLELVNALYRLTEGDPLLVKLYTDILRTEMRAGRSSQITFSEFAPGFEGYLDFFNQWWKDQKELWDPQRKGNSPLTDRLVGEFLACLSNALGPLTNKDITQLMPPELNITAFSLDAALRPLSRLVVGNGVDQGYSFSHSRMAVYFQRKYLDESVTRHWDDRFVCWGRGEVDGLITGSIRPEAFSQYLVQYFGAHLDRVNAGVEDYLFMITDAWRSVWAAHEFGHSGYLTDLERLHRVAEFSDQADISSGGKGRYIHAAIACALYRSSINGLYSRLNADLVWQLFVHGCWSSTQALAIARMLKPGLDKTALLLNLSGNFTEQEKQQISIEALNSTEEVEDSFKRARLLIQCAEHLTGVIQQRAILEAYASARRVTNSAIKGVLLRELAPYMTDPSPECLRSEALDLILSHPETETDNRSWGLAQVSEKLNEEERRLAFEVVQSFENETEKIKGTVALAQAGAELAKRLDVLAEIRKVESEALRGNLLLDLIPNLPDSTQPLIAAEAIHLLQTVEDAEERALKVLRAAVYLPEVERRETCSKVVSELLSNPEQIFHKKNFYEPLISAGHPEFGLQLARSFTGVDLAQGLVQVAPYLSETELQAACIEAFDIITKELIPRKPSMLSVFDHLSGIDLLLELGAYIPGSEYKKGLLLALEVSKGNWDEEKLVDALIELGKHQTATMCRKTSQAALNIAELIIEPKERVSRLFSLSENLPVQEKERAILAALAALQNIDDPKERAVILTKQIPSLPWNLRAQAVKDALESARSIQSGFDRTPALINLLPHLSNPELHRVRTEIQHLLSSLDAPHQARFYTLFANVDSSESPERFINRAQNAASQISLTKAGLIGEFFDFNIRMVARAGYTTQALKAARKLEDPFERAYLVEGIITNTSDVVRRRSLIREVLEISETLNDVFQRLWLLTGLVPLEAKFDRDDTLNLAEGLTMQLDDPLLQAAVMLNLALYSTPQKRRDMIEASCQLALQAQDKGEWPRALSHPWSYMLMLTNDPIRRMSARDVVMLNELDFYAMIKAMKEPKSHIIKGVIKLSEDLPRDQAAKLWYSALKKEATSGRGEVLDFVIETIPVIKTWTEEESIAKIVRSIQETKAMWQ